MKGKMGKTGEGFDYGGMEANIRWKRARKQ